MLRSQKLAVFYEIISQTGRGGQPDFISLIQKYICTQKYGKSSEKGYEEKNKSQIGSLAATTLGLICCQQKLRDTIVDCCLDKYESHSKELFQ